MSPPAEIPSEPVSILSLAPRSVAPLTSPVSVLLITSSYPPVLGGSEIEAQRVAAGLIRRGHRVKVLCMGEDPMPAGPSWLDPEGVPVRIFARRWPLRLRGYLFALGV